MEKIEIFLLINKSEIYKLEYAKENENKTQVFNVSKQILG